MNNMYNLEIELKYKVIDEEDFHDVFLVNSYCILQFNSILLNSNKLYVFGYRMKYDIVLAASIYSEWKFFVYYVNEDDEYIYEVESCKLNEIWTNNDNEIIDRQINIIDNINDGNSRQWYYSNKDTNDNILFKLIFKLIKNENDIYDLTQCLDNLKKGYEKYQLEINDNGQNKKY